MADHCSDNAGDRRLGAEWERRFVNSPATWQSPLLLPDITELLGEAKRVSHHSLTGEGAQVAKNDRSYFRILAYAPGGKS